MINKIKNHIRERFIKWLGIDYINNEIKRNYREFSAFKKISHEDVEIIQNQIHNINKTYSIGVDIDNRDHRNWAVLCIEGKPNYVKFVDLSRSDVREVQRFLKQFEGSGRMVDAPYGMDFMFSDSRLWDK